MEEVKAENTISRKKKHLQLVFGNLTEKNVETFKIITSQTLPVQYSEEFYDSFFHTTRYCKLGKKISEILHRNMKT
jgi:hypothetical protein